MAKADQLLMSSPTKVEVLGTKDEPAVGPVLPPLPEGTIDITRQPLWRPGS